MLKKQYSIEDHIPKFKVFKDRSVLSDGYIPDTILFRPDQMKELGYIYAAPFRNDIPRNVFCCGMPGTGKTLAARYWFLEVNRLMREHRRKDIAFGYLNFAAEKDLVSAMVSLCNQYADAVDVDFKVPKRGLDHSEYITRLLKRVKENKSYLYLIFDEVDQLYKNHSDRANAIIYSFLRAETVFGSKNVALNMITNNTQLDNQFTPAVNSSLSARKLFFPRYNAEELRQILEERIPKAFDAVDVTNGAVNLIAARIAGDSGDARKALQLLEHAAELVEHKARREITEKDVEEAYELSETRLIEQQLPTLPAHYQLAFFGVVLAEAKAREDGGSKELHSFRMALVYDNYCFVAKKVGKDPVSDRKFQDIISELAVSGLVSADMVYGGRGNGNAKMISLTSPFEAVDAAVQKLIHNGKLGWEGLKLS